MSNIDITKPLLECLKQFKEAPKGDKEIRQKALEEDFVLLAKKLLYGGYLMVGNKYRIDLDLVEFYYHEEKKDMENGIYDYIVYHRNGRYPGDPVPPFPIMSLHAHTSGYDITFEDPDGKYRASALIRAYSIFDLKKQGYVTIKDDKGKALKEYRTNKEFCAKTNIDDRSQYLYYFLNGFSIEGNDNLIKWEPIEIDTNKPLPIYRGHRKNVFTQDEKGIIIKDRKVTLDVRKWAFSKIENTEIKHSRAKNKDSDGFSDKELYELVQP